MILDFQKRTLLALCLAEMSHIMRRIERAGRLLDLGINRPAGITYNPTTVPAIRLPRLGDVLDPKWTDTVTVKVPTRVSSMSAGTSFRQL